MEAAASSGITVSPSQAFRAVKKILKSGRVPMLHGSPAIGKSSIMGQVAEEKKLFLIDLRLSQCEPTDLLGFPYIDKETGRSMYMPFDSFPIEGDTIPEGCNGWLLFLDEITSAEPPTQAAAYKVILDRKVGKHKLHPNVYVVAAGNLETDNAVVHHMSTALQSRMTHLKLCLSVEEWITWAINEGFDHRIIDFINWKKDYLYTFDPEHNDLTYASPRTWHMNNDCLVVGCGGNIADPDFRAISAGNVTDGITREFIEFCDIYQNLTKVEDIIMAPTTVAVPGEVSILFALTGAIGSAATEENIGALLQYVSRMPVEYQVVTLRYAIKRNPKIKSVPQVSAWLAKNIAVLF